MVTIIIGAQWESCLIFGTLTDVKYIRKCYLGPCSRQTINFGMDRSGFKLWFHNLLAV